MGAEGRVVRSSVQVPPPHPPHFVFSILNVTGGKSTWLEPRTSRIPCKHSDHWATKPHARPVTTSLCLIRFDLKSAWNHAGTEESAFAAHSRSTDPHWATICYGRKNHMAWPGLEPKTSRTPCKHSDHWATKPRGRPVTISRPPPCIRYVSNLLGTMLEPLRQSLCCLQHEHGPTLSHKQGWSNCNL